MKMLNQVVRNCISSPLGANLILALCNNRAPAVEKYLQIHRSLLNSKTCTVKNKIFHSPYHNIDRVQDLSLEYEAVDFTSSDNAAYPINDWIHSHTDLKCNMGKYVSPNAAAVVASIIIFEDSWRYCGDSSPIAKVYNSFNYTEDVKYEARILEFPLRDEDFKLVIVVPNEADTLRELCARLSAGGLAAAIDSIRPLFTATHRLAAPNIKVDSEIESSIQEGLTSVKAVQFGSGKIDENGAFLKVITCSTNGQSSVEGLSITDKTFFFSVIFKDTPIFTGQYIS